MPGIAGLISHRPRADCESRVQAMLGAMRHESYYVSGTDSVPDLGVYAGWTAHPGAFATRRPADGRAIRVLVFSGECFHDEGSPLPSGEATGGCDWVARRYEALGDKCFETFNGLFAGLLVDRQRRQVHLFNDRYGFDRVYWHETPDELFFASEAAALLRVLPHLREFDSEGVVQFLAVGCTLGGRSLFRGLQLLPAGSAWTFESDQWKRRRYFSPETWENQPTLSGDAFESALLATLKRTVPRYFGTNSETGVALTAGLDTRMLLACRPPTARPAICYTFAGQNGTTLDARQAAKVARACGLQHQLIRLGPDFFSNFGDEVERTVRVTSGCFGVLGAHEIYLNRQARTLAPVRLTGVFGGEVLRQVSTFKPRGLAPGILAPGIRSAVRDCAEELRRSQAHPVTFAAFQEIPWNIHGSITACRSQVTFRSPYLDNELVALAYRAPPSCRRSAHSAVEVVRSADPALAAIPTDMGLLGKATGLRSIASRSGSKVMFKLDYLSNEGLPGWLSILDPVIGYTGSHFGVPGLHKYLWYRRWFRRELADYIRASVKASAEAPFWETGLVSRLPQMHTGGRGNWAQELDAVITLGTIQRAILGSG